MDKLSESNAAKFALFEGGYTPAKNGVGCSRCGTELTDLYPGYTATRNPGMPPETKIKCSGCGFQGYRIV